VIGSLINAGCIVLAGAAVWARVPAIPVAAQRRLQALVAVVTMGLGFQVIWRSLHGTIGQVVRQLAVLAVALVLGRLTGQGLGLQARLNRLGRFARERLMGAPPAGRRRLGDVFAAATLVFCLTPLAVVGPMLEGLRGDLRALLVKSAVDGLATLGLARTRGWPVMLGAVPVLSLQGSLGLLLLGWRERFELPGVADAVCATGGFLLVAVGMVMLQVLRIRLADYLPALCWAGFLGWVWP
jgi:hypothetical protein